MLTSQNKFDERLFSKADLDALTPVLGMRDKEAMLLELNGPNAVVFDQEAWTLIYNGDIIACYGLIPIYPGVAGLWAVVSSNLSNHLRHAIRFGKKRLMDVEYKRVQCYVCETTPLGRKLVESLGFVNETPNGMVGYLDDLTWYLYSRVKACGQQLPPY